MKIKKEKSVYWIIFILLLIITLLVFTNNKQLENINSKAFANGYEICLDYYSKPQFEIYNVSDCLFNMEEQKYWCYND